ncbi:MAG: DinB family protein [Ignavibacteria bacterium]|nr:DinB family protein [Ignavibacteria bacterium]
MNQNNIRSEQFYRQWKILTEDWIALYLRLLEEKDYEIEISPGKNHGIFILGHLIASDDDFSLYMGKGEILFPEIQNLFASPNSLKPVSDYPPLPELKDKWNSVCEKNNLIYQNLTDNELDEIHAKCENPDTDYFKTKEKIIISWQFHQAFHVGQLATIYSKAKELKK